MGKVSLGCTKGEEKYNHLESSTTKGTMSMPFFMDHERDFEPPQNLASLKICSIRYKNSKWIERIKFPYTNPRIGKMMVWTSNNTKAFPLDFTGV